MGALQPSAAVLSDRQALAAISARVNAQLDAHPAVGRLPVRALDIFAVQNFLRPEECAALIALIDADAVPSILYEGGDPAYRTSHSCNLDRWHPFIRGIDARLCALMDITEPHGEALQGQRYTVGQQFKPHFDFFEEDQAYWPVEAARGGQRSWTVMIFLNRPEEGGATDFPAADFHVRPNPGMALIWNNMTAEGQPNPYSQHAGLPVTAGIKHVVTKWFRERPYDIQ